LVINIPCMVDKKADTRQWWSVPVVVCAQRH